MINEFIDYLKGVKDTSENTLLSYRRDLLRMTDYMKRRGITDVRDISEDRVLDYVRSLMEEQFATSSIARHNTSIKAFFRYLLENGNIDDNPAENIKSPRLEKKGMRVLSEAEVESLLSQDFGTSAKGVRDKAILELMYATGLKASEVTGLGMDNIDIAISCIKLAGRAGDGADRMIPYGKKAREALNIYLQRGRDELLRDNEDDGTVFLNCNGTPISRQGLWKLIKNYVKKAGIDADITPFTLRHSFAAHLVENGADAPSLQEMMGYTGESSTTRYLSGRKKTKDPYEWARIRN
ncbi:MAG: tyrosine-type recombinase/integrase [Butyrivibrio sp.]|nr:tyrosine-type recombinase/integrase [Butyrivibrio sp.]